MKKAWLLFLCKKGGFLMNVNSDNRTIAFLFDSGFYRLCGLRGLGDL